ncbi:MAG: ABC transporter ATP-binding protein [Peptococcaceae bacterium]|nr:ABC transporter ATP-binding protein [Peptococcaceae bacterium]
MMTTVVQTKNLTKTYAMGEMQVQALDGVDFSVSAGEFVAIIGKSGSGKSTLLHMLGGLDVPTSGSVIVDGNALNSLDRTQLALFRRRRVGFIFQQYNLIPDLNVWDNIIFPLALDGVAIDTEFIDELLTALHIADKRDRMPSQLSGGEQQRVAIARALAMRPALILADEPTGNLDTTTSHEVMGLIRTLAAKLGQTLIVVTHDIDIAQLADRIVEMRDGRIVKGGGPNACE